ncbi:DNA binding protein [Aureococcus anophagefferens]|nr:DNA binding protein [Aureococcus anophagefferens]
MTFDFCVDGCDEDITVGPYYDGSSYNVTGDASYYNEYVRVDRATEDLVVSAVGYGRHGHAQRARLPGHVLHLRRGDVRAIAGALRDPDDGGADDRGADDDADDSPAVGAPSLFPTTPAPSTAPSVAPTTCTVDPVFCVYTDAVTAYAIDVVQGETQEVFAIPASQRRTWIQLDATADIDLKLETSGGVVLLDYSTGTNWANSLTEYTYAGMTFDFCVDGCDEDITVGPYYDGSSYNVTGDASYYKYVRRALRLPGHVLHLRRGDVRAIAGALRDPDDGGADDRGADDDADDSPAVGRAVAVPDDAGAVDHAVGRADDVHRRPGLCVYTDAVTAYAIDVVQGETQSLRDPGEPAAHLDPAGRDGGHRLEIETSGGVVLLDYSTGTNWANSLTEYTYAGMTFDFCVDGCGEDITVGPYNVTGDASYYNEYVYVDRATEDLVVSAVGYGSGTGTLSVLYDCPGTCCTCAAATPAVGRAVAVPDDAGAVDHAVGRADDVHRRPGLCVYTDAVTAYAIDVVQGETQVFAIPASQRRTWIQLDATADIDLKLETSGGVVLLDYSTGTNWANSYNVTGDASYYNEYVYVDRATEDLVVSAVGYGSGTGTLSVLYDCPGTCCTCAAATFAPSPAPSATPTTAAPTTAGPTTTPTTAPPSAAPSLFPTTPAPSTTPSVAPTTCTVDPVFCVYTDAVTAYAIDVVQGETQEVFAIPASQRRTWIQLDATADIDLKLETSGGVVLLDYSTGTNWANSLTEYTYAGMTFDFCVDGCGEDITVGPYYDGAAQRHRRRVLLQRVRVDRATEDLVVSAVGYGSGTGTLSVLYDCPAHPVFCVYTDAVTAYAIDVVQGETQEVFAIPASQRRTWIQLDATADIDLKLETSGGVVLLDYSTGTNWANSLTEYTYAGMTFDFCVDGCDEDITVGPYYDGSSYNVTGDASYYNEYVYVDRATEDLVVSAVGYGSGTGTLSPRRRPRRRCSRRPRRRRAAPIAPTTCTVDPVFCVYTDAVTAYAVDVVQGETQEVFAIPASQRRTWIQLDATADIDLKLETSGGVVLLDYSTGTNWANSLTEYTYAGMTFDFCVDGCDEDITVGPYYDGSSYDVVGSSSYFNEYVYVDRATEDLVVSAVGYGSGTGTLSVLFDCPGTCCTCAAATSAPSPAPSSTPTTAAPSLGPTTSRPTFEILTVDVALTRDASGCASFVSANESLVYARALAATLNVSVARVADVACAEYERTRPPSALVEDRVYWADRSVAPFDCETHYEPIQVLKYEGAATYSVREFSLADGAYDLLYDIDYFDGHVNAVALYDGGASGYYALGGRCWTWPPWRRTKTTSSSTGTGTYLVGLGFGRGARRPRRADGLADAYAVVNATVDWDGYDATAAATGFGAAFAYVAGGTRLFFASNEGQGLFELMLPVAVPAECWNAGFDVANHTACGGDAARIWRVADAVVATSNDGMNCPDGAGAWLALCADDVCWADDSVAPFDCASHGEPVQVLRYEGAATYSVREFSLTTGAYDLVYDLGWFDGHVNAVALLDGGSYGYYAVGSFDGYLCRFDNACRRSARRRPLELSTPNVGAIVGTSYYYAKNVGDRGGEAFYWVANVHTDAPTFNEVTRVAVSSELFEGSVLDVAVIEEAGDELVDDGDDGGTYLVGLGFGLEVLVVRIDAVGYPVAYAVLNATVDWGGAERGTTGFGAAFAYVLEDSTRLFFASNEGEGLFELTLPVTEGAYVSRLAAAAAATSNDGMNCPGGAASWIACADDICWSDLSVAPFDCEAHGNPVQVLKYDGADAYSVREFDLDSGSYTLVYDLDYVDGHVNAVALLDGGSYGYYAVGSFDGYLCRFDNASDYLFAVSSDLFEGSVLDVAAFEEDDEELVDDGDDHGTYLVGLGFDFEVLVVRVAETGYPLSYAVLPSSVDAVDDDNDDYADDTAGFGAAFAYADGGATRLFFAANGGKGLFELALPITVPSECWNTGTDVDDHVACDADDAAMIYRVSDAAEASSNDGLNCPSGFDDADACYDDICWSDQTVSSFDCDDHGLPVQVLKYDGADDYSVREFDPDSGTYDLVYDLDWFDGHVNAVALLDGGSYGYYAVGSFDGYLCRFDDAAAVCATTPLELDAPNVGAIVGTSYYYAKNVGDEDDEVFYWVADIHTDEPTFYGDYEFAVASDLFEGTVLDVAVVLVVRIAASGYPDAYAVLESDVDADDDDKLDDTAGFGAAFAYVDGDATRLFFASNGGAGLFELELPITVPSECWNAGTDVDDHVVCDDADDAEISRVSDAAEASSNDGMNCPDGDVDEDRRRAAAPRAARDGGPRRRGARGGSSSGPTVVPTAAPTVLPTSGVFSVIHATVEYETAGGASASAVAAETAAVVEASVAAGEFYAALEDAAEDLDLVVEIVAVGDVAAVRDTYCHCMPAAPSKTVIAALGDCVRVCSVVPVR